MKSLLLLIAALLAMPALAASSVENRPGARITVTDEAYFGIKADPIPTPMGKLEAKAVATGGAGAADTGEPMPTWNVKAGAWLRDVLDEWTRKAGWDMTWGLGPQDDIRLGGTNVYRGDFIQAVKEMVNSLPPEVKVYLTLVPENDPPLLYVTSEEPRK